MRAGAASGYLEDMTNETNAFGLTRNRTTGVVTASRFTTDHVLVRTRVIGTVVKVEDRWLAVSVYGGCPDRRYKTLRQAQQWLLDLATGDKETGL